MLKTKNKPAETIAEVSALHPPYATIAERLALRRAAREEFLTQNKFKKTGRTPLVGIVTTGVAPALLAELKNACECLDLHLFEIADLAHANFSALDLIVLPTTELARGREVMPALTHGAIPILAEKIAPKLFAHEYDPIDESGNSFFFRGEGVFPIFATLVRAVETFRFPYDWQGIVRNALESTN